MEYLVILLIVGTAAAAVLYPLLRRDNEEAASTDEAIERRVAEYREGLKNGTVCGKCYTVNPAGSKFCASCGRALR